MTSLEINDIMAKEEAMVGRYGFALPPFPNGPRDDFKALRDVERNVIDASSD